MHAHQVVSTIKLKFHPRTLYVHVHIYALSWKHEVTFFGRIFLHRSYARQRAKTSFDPTLRSGNNQKNDKPIASTIKVRRFQT